MTTMKGADPDTQPRVLKAIGYWIDKDADPRWISPRILVDRDWQPSHRARLVEYLKLGAPCARYMGYSWCRFRCKTPDALMGTKDLTDGVWQWPEGLHHYVEEHGIRLPDEFVNDVVARRFVHSDSLDSENYVIDWSFWGNWCRAEKARHPGVFDKILIRLGIRASRA
jgi:hypothetical protein